MLSNICCPKSTNYNPLYLLDHNRHSTEPQCAFSPSTLDVAIHVRLGDRKESLDDDAYFDYLEDFMGNVTSAVLARGHDRPVFHIFSETSSPCPSTEDGKFPEFTRWPVEMNQVRH